MMCIWQSAATIPVTSYANSGGTGDRTGIITGSSSSANIFSGTVSLLLDGDFTANSSHSMNINNGPFTGGDYFQFQFTAKKYIDEVKLYADRALSNAWGSWKFRVSNDGVSFADLNTFTWNTQTQTQVVTGMDFAGFTYLRIEKVGTTNPVTGVWFEEVEFKIAPGA